MSSSPHTPKRRQLPGFAVAGFALLFSLIIVVLAIGRGAAEAQPCDTSVWSNITYWSAVQRTNPAMYEAVERQARAEHDRLLLNTVRKITYRGEFDRIFTNCFQDFAPAQSGISDRWEWLALAPMYKRYALKMVVPFRTDATRTNVATYDPPEFSFGEFSEDRSPSHLRRGYHKMRTISAPEWKQILDAGGDVTAIGIKVKTNSPVAGFDEGWRDVLW